MPHTTQGELMNRESYLDAVEHAALQLKHIAKFEKVRAQMAQAEKIFGPIPKHQMKGCRVSSIAPE